MFSISLHNTGSIGSSIARIYRIIQQHNSKKRESLTGIYFHHIKKVEYI